MKKAKLLLPLPFLFTLVFLLSTGLNAQIKTPNPSPITTIKQEFGLGEIELVYSRPSMKGRSVFGDLVPYGKVWRTGANMATKIKFSEDINIGKKIIEAGEYSLFSIPGEKEWTLILNAVAVQPGSVNYSEADDIHRWVVPVKSLAEPVETFTIAFANVKDNEIDLQISWEKTRVSTTLTSDVDTKVMAQIDRIMVNPEANLMGIYFQAAQYYFKTDRDLEKALNWVNRAVELNDKAYWVIRLQSQILAANGKHKEAIKAAEKSKEVAKAAGNEDYVRMNEKAIAEWSKKK